MDETNPKSIFQKLFDFSFSELITPSIIKILYILGILSCGLGAAAALISGLVAGGIMAIVTLLVTPIIFVLGVIYLRVMLELMIVVFQIGEHTKQMARGSGGS